MITFKSMENYLKTKQVLTEFFSVLSKENIYPLDQNSFYQLASNLPMGKSGDFISSLEELQMNAQEHGSMPTSFYFVVKNNFVHSAIVDSGVGICKKLVPILKASFSGFITCGAILRLSLEEGITSTGVKGRGQGLNFISKFIDSADGELLIASNSGIVIQHKNSEKKVVFTTIENLDERTGTVAILKIPQ